MTINNQIEALSIRNTMVKPVNMTEFNNPFLLLSSTKALNELVVNTNPSSRAKVADIEPKTKFQKDPTGVPINVYTKDTATTPQVPKLTGSAKRERTRQKLKAGLAERTGKMKIEREARTAAREKAKVAVKPKPKESKIYTTKPASASVRTKPKKKTTIGGGVQKEKAGGGKAGKKKVGAPNRGIVAAKEAEATKKRLAKAKKALEKAGAGGMGGF